VNIPSKGSRRRKPPGTPAGKKLPILRADKGKGRPPDLDRILAKRVKELDCIYTLSSIFKKRALDIDSIIRETIKVMPDAWQYPDITGVRILLNGKESKTKKYSPTCRVQQCPIVAHGIQVGELAVSYSEERPERDEGPFLKEERSLLNYIAQRLSERSHRRSVEQRLVLSQKELRSLTTELALSEERERRKIAQAIHDKIGQVMAIVNIKIQALLAATPDAELARILSDIQELISEVIKDSRSLTFDLSPPILYELGFKAALEWFVERVEEQFGFIVHLNCQLRELPLSLEWRVMLFLAARELLINVAKHARAKSAQISVEKKNQAVIVTVRDDGVGMDMTRFKRGAASREGFGLFSIQERMKHMGGRFDISSKPKHGTCVTLLVPLTEQTIEGVKIDSPYFDR
jgi:two-component system NarL family sensor kinase